MDSRTLISLLAATSLHAVAFAALDATWLHSWTAPKPLMRDCLVELEEVAPDIPAVPLPMAPAPAPMPAKPVEPPSSPPVAELPPPPEPAPPPQVVAVPEPKPAPTPQPKIAPRPVAAPTLESKPKPAAAAPAPTRLATAKPQSSATATRTTGSGPGVTTGAATGASLGPSTSSRGTAPTLAMPAAYLSNPEPAYPAQSRRRKQEGTVLLGVEVSSEGRALQVEIDKSSGHSLLDEAALKAVRRWRFEPARLGNRPVASRVQVPIRFQFKPGSKVGSPD